MSKQTTMTIPEFLNMKNEKTSKSIFHKIKLDKCITILTMLLAFGYQIPVHVSSNQVPVEATSEGIKILYVITTVGLECIYDLTIGIASAL